MTGKLKVTDEGLCTVHSTLEMATGHLEQVLHGLKKQDAEALGAHSLIGKASAFSDSWRYAVQQIGTHAHDLDKFVRKVADTFSQLDQQLEHDLKQNAHQAGERQ